MEKKTEARSIRMTKSVFDYVINYGDSVGFNQKFEDMVLFCMKKEPVLKKNIAFYNDELKFLKLQIEQKREILEKLKIIENNINKLIDI